MTSRNESPKPVGLGYKRSSKKQCYDEMVQQQVKKVTQTFLRKQETKKQKMLNSFSMLNLSLFIVN